MSVKPLIGCTTYRKTTDGVQPVDVYGLMPAYVEAVASAGGLPVLIPLGLPEPDLQAILDRVDGLLLPGGGDMLPETYGGRRLDNMYGFDPDRDRVEMAVARQAVATGRPLLAICRGHQVLNVALGGTLWEDVAQFMPGAIRHDYYITHPRDFLSHEVAIEPDTTLHRLLGRTETMVNSLHHQGVRRLASPLRAVATSRDGLVEGAEVVGHPFAVSVQWHPENLVASEPVMRGLFAGLVEAAARVAVI